jgi:hypothetical protein
MFLAQAPAAAPGKATNGDAGRPAQTDRWRLTQIMTDVPGMDGLSRQHFDHPAYTRPAEQPSLWVRVRAVVAFEPLREAPGWQELRARFSDPLTQEPIRGQICQLTDIPESATWRQRGTHRRSWLQAGSGCRRRCIPRSLSDPLPARRGNRTGLQRGCAAFRFGQSAEQPGTAPTGLGRNSTAQASGSG